MYRGGQLRDISEVSEVGVIIIQQFRHLGPFAHPLSSSPSVDHAVTVAVTSLAEQNNQNENISQRKEEHLAFSKLCLYYLLCARSVWDL